MGCLVLLLALLAPRLVIVLLALFSDFMATAYDSALWPILGFLFAPFTTLAYALAVNQAGGVHGVGWTLLIILAVLMDLSAGNEGRRHGSRRRNTS